MHQMGKCQKQECTYERSIYENLKSSKPSTERKEAAAGFPGKCDKEAGQSPMEEHVKHSPDRMADYHSEVEEGSGDWLHFEAKFS